MKTARLIRCVASFCNYALSLTSFNPIAEILTESRPISGPGTLTDEKLVGRLRNGELLFHVVARSFCFYRSASANWASLDLVTVRSLSFLANVRRASKKETPCYLFRALVAFQHLVR